MDGCRNSEFPDDILVMLLHGSRRPEGCWVRCEGIKNGQLVGILLTVPDADFGVHVGDMISFTVVDRNESYMCIAEV